MTEKRITVTLDQELYESVREAAFEKRMSIAAFVRWSLSGVAASVVKKDV
jgi:hypothetical protein